jgi:trehalose 6-phosphate synthase/phosphatase
MRTDDDMVNQPEPDRYSNGIVAGAGRTESDVIPGRLLIVSNRLPMRVRVTGGVVRVDPSSGGLASGLRRWHERSDSLWLGWPGDLCGATTSSAPAIDRGLQQRRIVPVHLSGDQVDGYYHGFANRVLWPLFHYLIDRVPTDISGWDAYRAANESFAAAVVREYRPQDTIWVHDYQLMLVPALLRERLPQARIGFFLHIPFPASEVFRILPWGREILNGLLGADLLGFHTFAYLRHFVTSLRHVSGEEADIDCVRTAGREVQLGVFPMGIDTGEFATLAADADVLARVEAIRRDAGGRRIVLGIDRLDYTKGIPRRLETFERLLERDPTLRDGIRYIQIAVPSRERVDSYQQFQREVDARVGRINGAHGTPGSMPVHYVHRSVSPLDLVALYCAADVMLVTPLRDGMNLVAKEFAASRIDEDGVLVLSEFAGAAAELNGALIVNPYDIEAVADSIHRALSMPVEERRMRMRGLRRRVLQYDVHAWAGAFLEQLGRARSSGEQLTGTPPTRLLSSALDDLPPAGKVRLLLDYDGTLVPLARSPELAAPDNELLCLLDQLAASAGIQLDIVSGRPPETLEQWFGDCSLSLWAEHGFWHRRGPTASWEPAVPMVPPSMVGVRRILEQFAASTPGSHLEVKSASLAWHYRGASREFAARQAQELRMLLGDLLSNQPLEVLEGKKVIEVRMRGVSKGVVARRVEAEIEAGTVILAIGDDRTDEELFRALSPASLTVAVGRQPSAATYRLRDHREVRGILRSLLGRAEAAGAPTIVETFRDRLSA